jgi:uncharacterized membrane protein YbhN (UPF0104 family)
LKAFVAVGLLTWVFLTVPIADVGDGLRAAAPLPIGGAWALVLVGTWLSALRLRAAGRRQRLRLPMGGVTAANLAASFYGLFLPGYLSSGAIRWHKLSVLAGRRPGVLSAMIYSRLNYLVVLVLLGILGLLADAPRYESHHAAIGLLALLVIALLLHLLAFRGALLSLFESTSGLHGRVLPKRVSTRMRQFFQGATHFRRVPARERVTVWSISILEAASGIASVWLLTRSLDQDIDVITVTWLTTVIQLATEIPISIAGLGIREGGLILLLRPLGIAPASAVALSLLLFSRTVFLGAIGGLIEAYALWHGGPPEEGTERPPGA